MEIIIASEELTKMRRTVIKDFTAILSKVGRFDSKRFRMGTNLPLEWTDHSFFHCDVVGKDRYSLLSMKRTKAEITIKMRVDLFRAFGVTPDYNPNTIFYF